HRALVRLRGVRWTEKSESQVTREVLTRLDVYKAASHGLAMVDYIRGADFQARGLLLTLRTGERMRVGRALAMEAMYVATQGNISEARPRRLLAETQRIASLDGGSYLGAWAQAAYGIVNHMTGRFGPPIVEALAKAEERFRAEPTMSWEANTIRIFRILIHRQRGTFREMRRLVDTSVRDAGYRGDRYLETTVRRCGSVAWLAADDPGEARRNLELATWPPPERGFHLQHYFELDAKGDLAIYERE